MKLPVPLLPRWVRLLGVGFVASFIFYTSILTTPPANPVVPGKPDLLPLDKWRHFLAYATLAYSLVYATADRERATWQLLVFVVSVTVLYGIGIEFWQSFIPNRYFSLGDAYANALGGLLVLPWYLVRPHVDFHPILRRLSFGE